MTFFQWIRKLMGSQTRYANGNCAPVTPIEERQTVEAQLDKHEARLDRIDRFINHVGEAMQERKEHGQ